MNCEEIIKRIEFNNDGKFYLDELEEIITNKDDYIPHLINIIKNCSENIEKIPEGYFAHIYSLYLLAQFQEIKALEHIIKFFSYPGEKSLDETGDVVTEDLHRILGSICKENIEPIQKIIEDEKINEYVRGAAVKSLGVLVANKIKPREEIARYFHELFESKLERKSSSVWNSLLEVSLDIYVDDILYEDIQKADKDGLFYSFIIDRLKYLKEYRKAGEEKMLDRLYEFEHYSFITDTISGLVNWACFKNTKHLKIKNKTPKIKSKYANDFLFGKALPISDSDFDDNIDDEEKTENKIKIGRNEPCVCGSGKKYKKCCGKNA